MANQPSTRRHPIFARFYARISPTMDAQGGVEHRRALLDGLTGRVLEVGAGNGLNFAHYPPTVSEVLAVEPEPYLRGLAEVAAGQAPVPVRVADGTADALPAPDASMDATVASLVLCSVPNQAHALAQLHRVLHPDGELRFFEHVRADTPFLARVQRLADLVAHPLGRLSHQPRHPGRHHHRRLPDHQPPAVPVPREPAAPAGRAPCPWGRPAPIQSPGGRKLAALGCKGGAIEHPSRAVSQAR